MEQLAAIWDATVLGIRIGPPLAALAVFAAFWALRAWLGARLRGWAEALTRRTENLIDDRVGLALEPPLAFAPVVLGAFFADQILALDGLAGETLDAVVKSLFAGTVFWAMSRMIEPLAFAASGVERTLTRELTGWMWRAARIAVLVIGVATVLEIWGVNVAAVIAGFGLLGVAVALGAQDMFKNLISGFLILAERRFRVGDWIKVDGVVEGTVEAITFRSTKVHRFDAAPVYVPNAKLADGALVNFGERAHRRIYWTVPLDRRAGEAQLRRVRDQVEARIDGDADILAPDEATRLVRLDRLGDSSVDLMLYCFTRTPAWAEWLEIQERLIHDVRAIVADAGAEIALPAQAVVVQGGPPRAAPEALEQTAPAIGA